MQAKEIGMFVLCISLAVGIVNALGVFPQIAGGEAAADAGKLDIYANTGITDLDSVQAEDQGALEGLLNFGILGAGISTIITMLKLVTYPYGLLTSWGVPPMFALPIQLIVNAATIWSVAQFLTNRSGKSMD